MCNHNCDCGGGQNLIRKKKRKEVLSTIGYYNCDCAEELERQEQARLRIEDERRRAAAASPYTAKHYLGGMAMMLAMLVGFFKSIDQDTAHGILSTVGLGFLIPPRPPKGPCIKRNIQRWPRQEQTLR